MSFRFLSTRVHGPYFHYFNQLGNTEIPKRRLLIQSTVMKAAPEVKIQLTHESLRYLPMVEAFSFILDNADDFGINTHKAARSLFDTIIQYEIELQKESNKPSYDHGDLVLIYWKGFQDTIRNHAQLIKTIARLNPEHRLQFTLDNLHRIKNFSDAMEIFHSCFVSPLDFDPEFPKSGLVKDSPDSRLAFVSAMRHTITTAEASQKISHELGSDQKLAFSFWDLPIANVSSRGKACKILADLKETHPAFMKTDISNPIEETVTPHQ